MKSNNHNKEHGKIWFIPREKEIIIMWEEKEIATITLETMEKDAKNGIGPTENFWLCLSPSGMGKIDCGIPNAIEVYTKGR